MSCEQRRNGSPRPTPAKNWRRRRRERDRSRVTSIDKRTREPGHHVASTLEELVEEVLPGAHHDLAERGHRQLGLPPVSLVVDGGSWTFDPGVDGDPVQVTVD